MKFFSPLTAIAVAALCSGPAWAQAPAHGPPAAVAEVERSAGDVRILRRNQVRTVGAKEALQPGDTMRTGPGARLLLRFTDGSTHQRLAVVIDPSNPRVVRFRPIGNKESGGGPLYRIGGLKRLDYRVEPPA